MPRQKYPHFPTFFQCPHFYFPNSFDDKIMGGLKTQFQTSNPSFLLQPVPPPPNPNMFTCFEKGGRGKGKSREWIPIKVLKWISLPLFFTLWGGGGESCQDWKILAFEEMVETDSTDNYSKEFSFFSFFFNGGGNPGPLKSCGGGI